MDLEKRRFGKFLFVIEILNESCKNQCSALTTPSIWRGGVATSPPFPVWCVVRLASGFCGNCSSQQAQQAQRSRVSTVAGVGVDMCLPTAQFTSIEVS